MEVYKDGGLIYSVSVHIEGHYYCCGSKNFEYDKVDRHITKDYEYKNEIYKDLQKRYRNVFNGTVLSIWTTRIFKELCDEPWIPYHL